MQIKKLSTATLLLLSFFHATAQRFTGKVVDETASPAGYATVVVRSDRDSTIIRGCITDGEGAFSLDVAENREYLLQISYLGYRTHTQRSLPADLGTIGLLPDETVLGEVVVKGCLPQYKAVSGGISVQVANTVLSRAGTAEDAMEHLPGTRKRPDGTFEVIGKGAPLIYIDNRKIRDLTELERLSSEEIRQMELITTPGSGYDASAGAVIRIRTSGNSREGFALKIASSAAFSRKMNTDQQLNWDYRHKRLELFGSFRYSLSRAEQTAESDITTCADTVWRQRISSADKSGTQSLFGSAGVNFEANPRNSLGIMYEITHMPESSMKNVTRTEVRADGTAYDVWETFDTADERFRPTHHVNAYWTGAFDRLSIEIDADMLAGRSSGSESVREYGAYCGNVMLDTEEWSENRLYAGKAVLSHSVGTGRLSGGAEYTHTERLAGSTGYAETIAGTDDRIRDDNLAFFLGYEGTLGKAGIQAGLRYEHVTYAFYENGAYSPEESKRYDHLFPALSLNVPIRNARLTFGYRIRTERPAYDMLKSAVHYGNRLTYLSGTPDLRPTYIQSVEVGGQYRELQISVCFNSFRDDILFMAEPLETDPKISVNKFGNIDRRNELVFSAVFAPAINRWRPEWMAACNTQWLDVPHLDGRKSLNGSVFHLQWGNAFVLPADFLLRIDVCWESPGYSRNQRLRASGFANISLNKDFARGKWNLMLEADDLFHTIREASWQYDRRNLEYRVSTGSTRQIKIAVRCKLNDSRNRYKGTGAGTDEMRRL